MASRPIEEIKAELAVVDLEEQLLAAKATPDGPSVELKNELRAARQAFRTLRAARGAGPDTARPDTIATDTDVNDSKGA